MLMTQYQIAKRLGVSETAVSKWFTGKSKPRVAHLVALSKLLGKDVNSTLRELDKKVHKK
jgi:transcriptional regulator with XRE-family HTH domain